MLNDAAGFKKYILLLAIQICAEGLMCWQL